MRQYTVQASDSPALIAAKFAGCPKCAKDLPPVNPHKRTRTHENGFVTFDDLRVGEIINLPDSWFNGEHDALPPSYFKALPHADGVTLGVGATASQEDGMSTGGKVVLTLLAAATIVGVTYAVTESARHA